MMNLDTVVKQGSRPWEPSPDVRDLDIWHEYDVPTTGTFVLGTERVLFTLLGSPDDRMTVWAYTALEDGEFPVGQEFGSVRELGRVVDGRFVGRRAAFAIADDLRLWRWTSMNVVKSAIQSATEFLGQGVPGKRIITRCRIRGQLAGVAAEV